MTTKCPLCGRSIDRARIDAHLIEHDRADAIERAITHTDRNGRQLDDDGVPIERPIPGGFAKASQDDL